jgi:hypothetical protein
MSKIMDGCRNLYIIFFNEPSLVQKHNLFYKRYHSYIQLQIEAAIGVQSSNSLDFVEFTLIMGEDEAAKDNFMGFIATFYVAIVAFSKR